MSKLKHSTASSVSVGGKTYSADEEGLFEIPEEHVAHLAESHGFQRHYPPAPAAAKKPRTDGPTLEEFVAAGYKPENYPPDGYAEKPSAGLEAFRKEQTEAKKKPEGKKAS